MRLATILLCCLIAAVALRAFPPSPEHQRDQAATSATAAYGDTDETEAPRRLPDFILAHALSVPGENSNEADVQQEHVRLATHTAIPLASMGLSGAEPPEFMFQTIRQKIGDLETIWPIDRQTTVLRLASVEATVEGMGDADKLEAFTRAVPGTETPQIDLKSEGSDRWSLKLSGIVAGRQSLIIKRKEDGATLGQIEMISPLNVLERPRLSAVSVNSHAAPDAATKGECRVFGRYLKLAGLRADAGTDLSFPTFNDAGEFLGDARKLTPVRFTPGSRWEAEVELPEADHFSSDGNSGRLGIVAKQEPSDAHQFANELLTFTIALSDQNPVTAPFDLFLSTDEGGQAKIEPSDAVHYASSADLWVHGKIDTSGLPAPGRREDVRIIVFVNGQASAPEIKIGEDDSWICRLKLADGTYRIQAAAVLGNGLPGEDFEPPLNLRVRTAGPSVATVVPNTPLTEVKVTFDEEVAIPGTPADKDFLAQTFKLVPDRAGQQPLSPSSSDPPQGAAEICSRSINLTFADVPPGAYTLRIEKSKLKNRFGVSMTSEANTTTKVFQPIDPKDPPVTPGIQGATGEYVRFPEYTPPRPFQDGFNPSDHVETRVSRLYYYRDAHRVAQIVNRKSESHNRAAVQMHRQLADKARQIADSATDARQANERRAIETANKTREAERALEQAQAEANSAANLALTAARDVQAAEAARDSAEEDQKVKMQAKVDDLRSRLAQMESLAEATRAKVTSALNKVESLRETESRANEAWQASIAVEDRAREEQFRREVAAAHADPDTYAEGKPDSADPVEQVSVSVIGEGLIQLRGPLKGVNAIRTMINQIDAPVGQVRIGVHTVQINGERGDRMEEVAARIQRYIDHSRFLTLHSAEMLRRAVVQVAAQKAMEINALPGMTQEERDRKYLYAFFGDDFIRELEVMDSEFLRTGNKLLSLHSMDSTSLASALFLMALAKNGTRLQILEAFEGMMAGELPLAEQNYYEAGLTCEDGRRCRGCNRCRARRGEEFQLLSANARFQSLRGFFNADLGVDDTMGPLQREFVRLAQIFKSRLIVEMELRQRIMERAVIEERMGNRKEELEEARRKEKDAQTELSKAQGAIREAQRAVFAAGQKIQVTVLEIQTGASTLQARTVQLQDIISSVVSQIENQFSQQEPAVVGGARKAAEGTRPRAGLKDMLFSPIQPDDSLGKRILQYSASQRGAGTKGLSASDQNGAHFPRRATVHWDDVRDLNVTIQADGTIQVDAPGQPQALREKYEVLKAELAKARKFIDKFHLTPPYQVKLDLADEILNRCQSDSDIANSIFLRVHVLGYYASVLNHIASTAQKFTFEVGKILSDANAQGANFAELSKRWLLVEQAMLDLAGDEIQRETLEIRNNARAAFQETLKRELEWRTALELAEAARRPLDHKKFLDMLVDDMEDKYIELLEGTRAHTANIDAYLKRLTTALDDDFNTQFYYPAFRHVRHASRDWDVQLSQVETTTILANNRDFGKVSPQATMEFDLPKRDILISEAIDGAKATIDDIGALAADPTFLSLAKLKSGQPTSSPAIGATAGLATVRNVLPGLETSTAETVLGQHGPGGTQFGAAMESLIPDPAIYKFETGTGYEVRPVIQPDGQAVVFDFNYMYTTNVREPVRADEKHLGRVKRHFIDTDVQLSNFELREVSRYTVALKAARTSRGVPLLEDLPVVGALWRPLPSNESSLQQNIILGQATIFPTLFDLMGLRWAPAVADLDSLRLINDEFIVRNRRRALMNRVFDHSSSKVDEFLRIPEGERRMDLYRSQETIPGVHPNGYSGPGANLRDSHLQEGYAPASQPPAQPVPGASPEGSPLRPVRPLLWSQGAPSLNSPSGVDAGGAVAPGAGAGPQPIEEIPPPNPELPAGGSPTTRDGATWLPRPRHGEVVPAAYLQPVAQTPTLLPVGPSAGGRGPLPPPSELRRLPAVAGKAPAN